MYIIIINLSISILLHVGHTFPNIDNFRFSFSESVANGVLRLVPVWVKKLLFDLANVNFYRTLVVPLVVPIILSIATLLYVGQWIPFPHNDDFRLAFSKSVW